MFGRHQFSYAAYEIAVYLFGRFNGAMEKDLRASPMI